MGRSKPTPVRNNPNNTQALTTDGSTACSLMGRRFCQDACSVDILLAAELREEKEEEEEKERVRQRRAPTSVVERIEARTKQELARNRCKKGKPTRNKNNIRQASRNETKTKKSVAFSGATAEILPPELHVNTVQDDGRLVVYYQPRKEEDVDYGDDFIHEKEWVLLVEYPIATGTAIQFVHEGGDEEDSVWKITTPEAVRAVCQHLVSHLERHEAILAETVVSSKLLTLEIAPSRSMVRIWLPQSSVRLCNRVAIPSNLRHNAPSLLQEFMSRVILRPAMDPAATLSVPAAPVTAKQVYKLTDNVQLKASMRKQEQSSTAILPTIPGLVPTLRPYQEHAVRWMLQRERMGGATADDDEENNNNNEWELAWVVVSKDGAVVTLPSSTWKDEDGSKACNLLLYCPSTGWFAESVKQARSMTVGAGDTPSGGILGEAMGLGTCLPVLYRRVSWRFVAQECNSYKFLHNVIFFL
jgi:hypothetical protein